MKFMLEYYMIKLVDVDALLHANAAEVISDVSTTHLIYLLCFQKLTPPQFQQVSMVCIICKSGFSTFIWKTRGLMRYSKFYGKSPQRCDFYEW